MNIIDTDTIAIIDHSFNSGNDLWDASCTPEHNGTTEGLLQAVKQAAECSGEYEEGDVIAVRADDVEYSLTLEGDCSYRIA